MPDPIHRFAEGVPLSARLLNGLQEEILRQIHEHTHTGGEQGTQLQTGAYTDKSVTEPKLADGAVSLRTLADGAVGPGKLADDAVTAGAIADGAVGTDQIADDAVTEAKLDPNVVLKLNRIGGGVSSASTVIWRDPIDVFVPPTGSPPLIDTLYQPDQVYWIPPMIGLDEADTPYRLNPKLTVVNGQNVLDPYDVFEAGRLEREEPRLAQIVSDQILVAGQEIGLVGAFASQGVSGFRADGQELMFSQPTGVTTGEASALRRLESGGVGGTRAISTEARMMATRSMSQPASSPRLSSGLSITGAQPTAPRAMAMTAAPTAASQPAPVVLTDNGAQAAVRMTTVGVVDEKGKAVPPGTEGAFTIAAGFPGKKTFTGDGPSIDYRTIGNDADRKRAVSVAAETLYNLGIDSQFIAKSKANPPEGELQKLNLLLGENETFFDQNSVFWGPQSWLPDLLNNPQLFGSGYAISGGRNILSVTRIPVKTIVGQSAGIPLVVRLPGYVRVRFITPYKDAAYAVSVTPRSVSGVAVWPHVFKKTAAYCDLEFLTLDSGDGAQLARSDKVSFDLAVFGDLASAS